MVCDRAGIMSSWSLVQVPQIEQAVAIPTESLCQHWLIVGEVFPSPTSARFRQGIGFLARPTRVERVIVALRGQSLNKCDERTDAPRQTASSYDHLVCASHGRRGNLEQSLGWLAGCALRNGLTNCGTSTFRWRCHNGRSTPT